MKPPRSLSLAAARRLNRVAAPILALALALPAAPAGAVEEVELKAAITYNLLLFVDWPADALPDGAAALSLCVSPDSALYAALKTLNRRPVGARVLEVRDLAGAKGAGACHALFVDAPPRAGEGVALEQAAATLVVSDDAPAPPDKAAIVLRRVASRVAFDVNLRAARGARLQLSSKLLRLAQEVRE